MGKNSRVARYGLLAGTAVALAAFAAAMVAVKLIEMDAAAQPTQPMPGYAFAADVAGTVRYLTAGQDAVLAFAVPVMWIGILAALVLALVYSLVQQQAAERTDSRSRPASPGHSSPIYRSRPGTNI